VGEGRHHDVNLAATGAIIALLNRQRGRGEEGRVAYFFGGDGATFLVPADPTREAPLRGYRNLPFIYLRCYLRGRSARSLW
jgi:hypothetical protein